MPAFGFSTSQPMRFRPSHQHVAAVLVFLGDRFDGRFAVPHGDDGGDLHGLEDAVVVVAFDRREGPDHFAVAAAEADPPAGHAVAFAHRRQFDADVDRAGRGEETGGL